MCPGMLVLLTAWACQQQPQDLDKAALARINLHRQTAGLSPVTLDPELCKGLTAHAAYLARNLDHPTTKKLGLLDEDPKLPGYTAAGKQACRTANLQTGDLPAGTVEKMMSTLAGRALLLFPDLQRVGIGHARDRRGLGITMLDVFSGRNRARDQAVLYPAPRQKDVPLAYVGPELPDPLPKEGGKQPGFPVTVTFPLNSNVRRVTASLQDAEGKAVAVWLSTPEKPAAEPAYQRNTICLIPREWLRADTRYTVAVAAEVGGKGWKETWTFTTADRTRPTPTANKEVIEQLNTYRQLAGLEPLILDADLANGCLAHAQYVVKNIDAIAAKKANANDEDPKLPGYTVEGQQAAKVSLVTDQEPVALVDNWMAGFYRRLALLNPELKRIGVGQARSERVPCICVLDLNRGRGSDQVVLYPADKQKNVPLFYGSETPNPVPETKDRKAGFPITVMVPPGVPVKGVTATLQESATREVPLWLQSPEVPASPAGQRNTILVLPKEPLKPNTTYTVTVKAMFRTEPWTRTWSFTTAKK